MFAIKEARSGPPKFPALTTLQPMKEQIEIALLASHRTKENLPVFGPFEDSLKERYVVLCVFCFEHLLERVNLTCDLFKNYIWSY
jgi:hypothetical protein